MMKLLPLLTLLPLSLQAKEITLNWSDSVEQQWIGRHFWQNSYRDWAQKNGRIEVVQPGGNRSAVVTSHAIDASQTFKLSTKLGILQKPSANKTGWGGFKLGLRGQWTHAKTWENQAMTCRGTAAGITADGRLFIDQIKDNAPQLTTQDLVTLTLEAIPSGADLTLVLTAKTATQEHSITTKVPQQQITGMFALTSHNGSLKNNKFDDNKGNKNGQLAHWFDELTMNGNAITATPERQFGPIAFNQFLTSSDTLRMNVQLPPLDIKYTDAINLEVQQDGAWRKIAAATYHQPSSTALFTVPDWDTSTTTPYRVTWLGTGFDGKTYTHHYPGTIMAEPKQSNVTLGSFNCMFWTGFPYADSVSNMKKSKPHILAFTGDQLYEGAGGYGCIFGPYEDARLNYFQHWFLHGLAFRDLLANTASMTINDDHDVFHGNIWGEAGKAADMTQSGAANQQDSGGYKMYPQFVNLVQKSQCGHLPPSPDQAPVKQAIETYYTDVRYAGVSFAVLEDRKWKSAPKNIHHNQEVYNGFFKDPDYASNASQIRKDSAHAELLGKRQEQFLETWAADWSDQTWMKCVVSQTAFTTAATNGLNIKHPWDRYDDKNFPEAGAWPKNAQIPSHDMDANGWPAVARDRAVHIMRKAFAPHVTGDQHLGSMIRYGIEEHDSGSVAFCVPAAATGWSRLWMPKKPGILDETFIGKLNGEGFSFDPKHYCGKFLDGHGNKFTMLAAANPQKQQKRQPHSYYDRNPGYGVITFHRETHDITLAAWPAYAAPGGQGDEGRPYAGWPLTIKQTDNYNKSAKGFLPTVSLGNSPVVQVINDTNGEIEYTIRPSGDTFKPRVFDTSSLYTLRVGDPDAETWHIQQGLKAQAQ
ncbi:hypothetical protein [Rubritalea tangerina]|uniref:PhoD-like phosphatase metallophosphatase domain-containing protein n=1 Tax=Rubritalea tangerina TaxID=430798 RepID=A0ABW4Z980_9BACT